MEIEYYQIDEFKEHLKLGIYGLNLDNRISRKISIYKQYH